MYFFWKRHQCRVGPLRLSGNEMRSSGNELALNKSRRGPAQKKDIGDVDVPPLSKYNTAVDHWGHLEHAEIVM